MKKLFVLILIPFILLNAQQKDPNKIIEDVKKKFDIVNDYEVDVTVKIDVNFIKVPESVAKIYFKKPDKIKFDSKGFALLPKEGLNFTPTKLFKDDYNAIFIKEDKLDKYTVDIVKIIPMEDSSEIIITKLWVDSKSKVIRKVETTTKKSGTFSVDFLYDKEEKYALPSQMKFSFNMSNMHLPHSISGQSENEKEKEGSNEKEKNSMQGTVIVNYKNYIINKGVPDSIFKETKTKK